jgi:regulator of protease activity HflC (stomatin/prohibitin superfamily)
MVIIGIVTGYLAAIVIEFVFLGILRFLGFYIIVNEGTAQVYTFFGKVIGEIREPGIHCLWLKPWLLWRAPLIRFFGKIYTINLRLEQKYLRSQPVNSEEGAPMGIGIWYEMFINNASDYLFKNNDPEGSLAANVSNATVRCLSNMPLGKLLEERHTLSQTVRQEVTERSKEWGYSLGSVYIRKVHFRDTNMIKQIESKVVNRLRQVTSAINQDGENQVNIITSSAQSKSATEFAKAAAVRPKIVGEALQKISINPEVASALFEVLETKALLESQAEVTLIPKEVGLISALIAGK